ncbi:glycoside hydrolase family 130 protein [Pedobacter cryophilus]|uniref:Pesticidal protein Cry7Aa n=1 Tax=Pedobacter cryophilus TaxID=2571271 RepID=A0A4U1C4K2_9SPHI|nr:pesticidal protein Cry7Aa [Pedobacter cryophilus]TKC00289.1 pesticidal protein Cry7Aa [Pedobacter cryophilus]
MVEVKKEGIILEKTSLGFENDGVFNPAVIKEGNTVHLFYRAVRVGNYSTVGYCRLEGPLKVVERYDKPVLFPQFDYEIQGVEDPRIVKIDDTYYMSYCTHDDLNAIGALATSKDLKEWTKHGIITPLLTYDEFKTLTEVNIGLNEKYYRYYSDYKLRGFLDKKLYLWDKNIVFFPRRINNQLVYLHRIRPGIQIVKINSLQDLTKTFWETYMLNFKDNIVLDPKYQHEASYLGGGAPPIETKEGWVMIYHGVEDAPKGYIYNACAALLDLDHPQKEISRLKVALFKPENNYEQEGVVSNVVFPTGTAMFDERLYIYYGAADAKIAVASLNFNELLTELINSKS